MDSEELEPYREAINGIFAILKEIAERLERIDNKLNETSEN